jgi:hypothetical protein
MTIQEDLDRIVAALQRMRIELTNLGNEGAAAPETSQAAAPPQDEGRAGAEQQA